MNPDPAPTDPTNPTPTPTQPTAPSEDVVLPVVVEAPAPLAPPAFVKDIGTQQLDTLEDGALPMAAGRYSEGWSLVNVALTVLGAGAAIAALISALRKRGTRKVAAATIATLAGIAVVVLMLTQNFAGAMTPTDGLTPLMAGLALVSVAAEIVGRARTKKDVL